MGKRSRESMGDPSAGLPEGKSKKRRKDGDGDKGKKKRLRELKKDITDLPGFEDDDGKEDKQSADEAGGVGVNGADAAVLSKKAEKKEKKKKRKQEQEESEAVKQEEAATANEPEGEEEQEPEKARKDKKDKKDKTDKKKKKKSDKKSRQGEAAPNGEEMDVDAPEEQGGAKVTEEPSQEGDAQEEEETIQGKAPRFIVFVGNLPYSATAESIRNHFAPLNPSSVRCLTKRDDPTKCRGCAFIEFSSSKNMRTCLDKWHHSTFEDGVSKARKINVELTAGGGGKTANRMDKIKKKNEKLNVNRTKRIEAEKKEKNSKASRKEEGGEKAQDNMHPSRRARLGN